ncbi:hypothetical protein HMPREF0379_0676 [[Eubacterium] yurii subsp. margaretiae ATCC 43715]|nr:hypothetical protein HMPREF0379_0676 [[Eubacterium] yurii subsp. margaretiae ATCC 43715]
MQVSAIICEYNPFHTGHKYQIDSIRKNIEDAAIICVMSGDFVQRGDVAIIDKHTRARIAVENGADLVLQLPTFFSTQVAEIFARGSVSLINLLGCVKYLCFGSESGDIEKLYERANKDTDEEVLRQRLKGGNSFASSYFESESMINMSNDILATEYIRALENFKSKIRPFAIKRQGANYNDKGLNEKFSSATAIRESLKKGDISKIESFIPSGSQPYFDIIKFDEDFFELIKYAILSKKYRLGEIFEIGEGLENRILSKIEESKDMEDLIKNIKSKRYTYTRIRRILFNILLDIKKSDIKEIKRRNFYIPYVRVLSFNDRGREVLKEIKKIANIKIINKVANHSIQEPYEKMLFEKDILATRIYNISKKSSYSDDYKTTPIYVK